jgi:hypothetical protein
VVEMVDVAAMVVRVVRVVVMAATVVQMADMDHNKIQTADLVVCTGNTRQNRRNNIQLFVVVEIQFEF